MHILHITDKKVLLGFLQHQTFLTRTHEHTQLLGPSLATVTHHLSVSTCGGPVVGVLVWSAVDETSQAAHSVGPHQDVTAEGSAVHHPDVERRMEKLIFW